MNSSIFPEISNQMLKRNQTLKDVAKILKLDISQISRKLSGKVVWTYSDIETLCNYYNMDFRKLFRRKED